MGKTFGMSGDETELAPWDWAPWKYWRDQGGTALVRGKTSGYPTVRRNRTSTMKLSTTLRGKTSGCFAVGRKRASTMRLLERSEWNSTTKRQDVGWCKYCILIVVWFGAREPGHPRRRPLAQFALAVHISHSSLSRSREGRSSLSARAVATA